MSRSVTVDPPKEPGMGHAQEKVTGTLQMITACSQTRVFCHCVDLEDTFPRCFPLPFLKISWEEGTCLDLVSAPKTLAANSAMFSELALRRTAYQYIVRGFCVFGSVCPFPVCLCLLSVHLGCLLLLMRVFFSCHEKPTATTMKTGMHATAC